MYYDLASNIVPDELLALLIEMTELNAIIS